jgi:hypothetical protein
MCDGPFHSMRFSGDCAVLYHNQPELHVKCVVGGGGATLSTFILKGHTVNSRGFPTHGKGEQNIQGRTLTGSTNGTAGVPLGPNSDGELQMMRPSQLVDPFRVVADNWMCVRFHGLETHGYSSCAPSGRFLSRATNRFSRCHSTADSLTRHKWSILRPAVERTGHSRRSYS